MELLTAIITLLNLIAIMKIINDIKKIAALTRLNVGSYLATIWDVPPLMRKPSFFFYYILNIIICQ